MARFYGWTDQDILSLDVKKASGYFRSMEILKAREMIDSIRMSWHPMFKHKDNEALLKAASTEAFPQEPEMGIEAPDGLQQLAELLRQKFQAK